MDLPDGPLVRNAFGSIIATGYALLGLSFCFEPSKWDRTPAYAVLLDIAPQRTWGLVLLFIAALLGTAMWVLPNRVLSVAAHLVAIMFTASWAVAFIVRWATDHAKSTTPMNGVMWLISLGGLAISLRAAERYWASIPGLRDLD
jgi:Ca2+/Na+ antiporter